MFSRIQTKYENLHNKSPCLFQTSERADQKKLQIKTLRAKKQLNVYITKNDTIRNILNEVMFRLPFVSFTLMNNLRNHFFPIRQLSQK